MRNHRIYARIGGTTGFFDRTRLHENLDPGPMRLLDKWSRIAPKQHENGYSLLDDCLEPLPRVLSIFFIRACRFKAGDYDVGAEWPAGELMHTLESPSSLVGRAATEYAATAGIRNGCCQFRPSRFYETD